MSIAEYYDHTTVPATSSSLSSATIRAEFQAVQDGISAKLPDLATNGNKAVIVNAGATALGVTTGTLALAGNFATSGASAVTLTSTGATNVTLPTTGTLATLAGSEALTNKTINGNTFTAGTYTLTGVAVKTLTFNNSLTLAGTDGTTMTFPSTSATIARTDAANSFTGTNTFGSATSLLLGTAGSAVGSVGFRNATSGTATLNPPTGALGTYAVTLPNAASTLPIFGQQITFAGPTAARTVTLPDANITVARTDAANTFTGIQTMTSPAITTPAFSGTSTGTYTLGGTLTLGAATLSGTISGGGNQINNVVIGTVTPLAGTFTTGTFGSTTSLLLGTAGSAVGNVGFRNATSGTATLAPPTGALGTYTVTLPNAASTLPIYTQQITYAGPTAARTITYPDANITVARTDAANTFTGIQTMTSPAITTPAFSGTSTGTYTLGGTLTLGAATLSGTISGGGNQINNVVIGTTTPLAGSFTVMSASSDSSFTSTGAVTIPVGTTAQQPAGAVGKIRYNSTLTRYEGYKGTNWLPLGGGATGASTDDVFYENSLIVTTSYTLSTGKNAMSTGPITINGGAVVTIPSGQRWVVL